MHKGWSEQLLGSFMEFKNGVNADSQSYGQGVKFVNVMDIFANNVLREESIIGSVSISEKQAADFDVRYGDILFNRTSETPEDIATASVYIGSDAVVFGGFVIRGRQSRSTLTPEYSSYVFRSDKIRRELIRRGQGAVRSNIGQKDLAKVPILVPPVTQQNRIAEILRTWDDSIKKLVLLYEAKSKKLDGIAATLIHNSQIERVYLRDILHHASQRNTGGRVERVLSVTNSKGFVLASEQFVHRVASIDVSNYKIVKKGQYAYNPSRINVGSIARLNDWNEGALSPMYVVFGTRPNIDTDYFGHWLNTGEARQRIALSAQGSVRETVSFGDLCSVPIPIPTLEKQAAIASALTAGREELTAIDKEITAFKRQKRGLMQKLLTGEWRVGVDDTMEVAE